MDSGEVIFAKVQDVIGKTGMYYVLKNYLLNNFNGSSAYIREIEIREIL